MKPDKDINVSLVDVVYDDCRCRLQRSGRASFGLAEGVSPLERSAPRLISTIAATQSEVHCKTSRRCRAPLRPAGGVLQVDGLAGTLAEWPSWGQRWFGA